MYRHGYNSNGNAFVVLLFYLQESNMSNRLFQVKTSFNQISEEQNSLYHRTSPAFSALVTP